MECFRARPLGHRVVRAGRGGVKAVMITATAPNAGPNCMTEGARRSASIPNSGDRMRSASRTPRQQAAWNGVPAAAPKDRVREVVHQHGAVSPLRSGRDVPMGRRSASDAYARSMTVLGLLQPCVCHLTRNAARLSGRGIGLEGHAEPTRRWRAGGLSLLERLARWKPTAARRLARREHGNGRDAHDPYAWRSAGWQSTSPCASTVRRTDSSFSISGRPCGTAAPLPKVDDHRPSRSGAIVPNWRR